jgi:osmotically-inducible protein OsmY
MAPRAREAYRLRKADDEEVAMTGKAARVPLTGRRARRRADSLSTPWVLAVATAGGVALGALLEYFLDPHGGRRRRHTARDRAVSRLRRTERRTARRARRTESNAVGAVKRTISARRGHAEPIDDITLAHKVESELFRRADVPKGQIAINAEDGVVFLRGVLEREEDITRVVTAARRLNGVQGVENLLHLPDTPAPPSRPKLVRERDGGD